MDQQLLLIHATHALELLMLCTVCGINYYWSTQPAADPMPELGCREKNRSKEYSLGSNYNCLST